MLKHLFLLAAIISPFQANSKDEVDLSKHLDLRKALNIYDYQIIKTLDFSDLEDKTAYTFLYKDEKDKNPAGYYVRIIPSAKGKHLFFTAPAECEIEKFNKDEVIEVNDTGVQASSACLLDSSKDKVLGFLLNTEAGKNYVIAQFKANKIVKIKFRSMIIPFESGDFAEVWNSISNNPL